MVLVIVYPSVSLCVTFRAGVDVATWATATLPSPGQPVPGSHWTVSPLGAAGSVTGGVRPASLEYAENPALFDARTR